MRSSVPILALILAACAPATDDGALPDDAPEGDSLDVDGKADGVGLGVPSSLGLDKKGIVYLTFDDGPSIYTGRILDTLRAHQAHAQFFITGANIAGREDLLRRERDEGHHVGNHQWQHVVATSANFRGYVTRERDLLHSIVGDMPPYFRYPYGAGASWKQTILAAEGYPDGGIGWDIDSLDWDFGPDATASRPEVPAAYKHDFEGYVMMRVAQKGGGVILMHDIQSITAAHLDSILTKLEAAGYRFGELPATRPFVGDACDGDADCTFSGGFCLGGVCTEACTSSCPDRAGYPTTRCARLPDGSGASVDACALDCSAGAACRAGVCTAATSPAGAARQVCWGG